jgi:DNA end-binding protein Ku
VPEAQTNDETRGRPFWSGLLSFGLVSIPVDLLPAHHSTGGAMHMIDEDGTRLSRRYYCPVDGQEIDADHLVKGYELDDGKVVVATDEELEALAPKKSREIDLRLFVDREGIDPLYFERSYFLAPGEGAGKAYRLLVTVMQDSRRAGIATFVMRDKEYLVAIFAEAGLLRAETLRFHDEVRSTRGLGLAKPSRVDDVTAKRVRQTVARLMQDTWDPSELSDPHDALRQLAERKYKQGKDVVKGERTPGREGADVIDLMAMLKQSLAQNDLAPKASRRHASKPKSKRAAAPASARSRPAARPTKRARRAGSASRSRDAAART